MENLKKEIDNFYENYQGASDQRSEEEKGFDYNQSEFVATANPVDWKEKRDDEWRSFPVLNQFYTLKCVAFTIAKLAMVNFWLKTNEFLKFSPNSIYDYRINKPSGGMVGNDAFEIWQSKGIALESVCKSEQVQESDPIEITDFAKEVAKGFMLGRHITIDNGDFDRVASTIQTTRKAIMVWFYFTSREWSSKFPKVMDNLSSPYDTRASRHSVSAVDYGLINGKEYIKIEDSAHFGGISERWISREFFVARNFLIKYPMEFKYEKAPLVEIPKITKTLRYKMVDPEVKILQTVLQSKGYYPKNIGTDNIFGSITLKSVKDFQRDNGLVIDGIVGEKTRAVLLK